MPGLHCQANPVVPAAFIEEIEACGATVETLE
jgi:hypothetical protein